jgi:hypothetical protein
MYLLPKGKCLRRATPSELIAFLIAYGDLLLASCAAREQALASFARRVALRDLRKKQVPDDILLWMLYQAHVEHFQPPAPGHAAARVASLCFTAESTFALTEPGAAFAETFLSATLAPRSEAEFEEARDRLLVGPLVPCYDKEDRVLSWGRHVLKCFRQPAANQEIVLSSAEELSWAPWFDDPLPRGGGRNPKVRLHDTIKDLNRRQTPHFVHFKGDGSGTRIGWELH